jgi:hypothetical protein
MSSSLRHQLLQEARDLGFVVVGYDGREHIRVQHSDTGRRVTLPNTVPNQRRRVANYRAMLRRAAGVSSQGQPAADPAPPPERRKRRKRRKRPAVDHEAARAARDRATILARKEREAVQVQRAGELAAVERLMRSTWT